MFKRFVVLSCVTILILASCTSTAVTPLAPDMPTVVPASAPTATAVPPVVVPTAAATAPVPASNPDTFSLPAGCYREGLPSYVNRAAKFCFAYPQHFSLGEMNPGQPAIFGPALDTSPDPLRATFTFQVKPAAGKSLADHLAEYALETGTSPETQPAEVALDGEDGKVIESVKGRPNAKSVLVLHGNNLYTFSFAPTLKDTPAAQQTDVWKKAQQDMQALYETVTSSFAFLDQPRAVDANNVLGITPSCLLEGNSLYLDSDLGYCLAIPARFTVDEMNPGQRAIFGPALEASPDPLRVSLLVDVKPVPAGSEVWKVADEFVKANPNSAITRGTTEIGRQAGVMLGNVPGRSNSVNVLTVNNSKLYNLYFQPDGNPLAKPDLDALSAVVMGSFGFLPSATPANSDRPANPGLPVNLEYGTDLVQDVKLRAVPALTEPSIPFDTYQYDFVGYVVKSSMPPRLWAFNTNLPPQSDSTLRGIDALARHVAARTTPGKTLPVYLTGPSANQLDLPMFVPVNARPILSTQWSNVQGSGVIGLRFVTVYMQGPNPLDPNTLVYAFSGLNPERNVAFAAVFPVRPAVELKLPVANIKALLDDPAKLDEYNRQIAEQIAQLGPSDFVPDLHRIDELMASLTARGPLPPITAKSDTQVVLGNGVHDGLTLKWPPFGEPVDDSPILQWESFPGADHYQVWVLDAGSAQVAVNQIITSTNLPVTPPLHKGTGYNWTVQARDAKEAVLAELNSYFTVKADLEQLSPQPGASVDASPILKWKIFPDAARYQVVIIDDGVYPPKVVLDQVTAGTSFTVTPPLAPGSYSWTVWAQDASSVTRAELVSQFTVAK